ncbi:hypothetical protein [Planococcus dechangensis]|uniref:Uncharacterized protein n=1 Tax=Planococcus dechangensis TaxID=1176255 RepID=A0ABV9MCF1_9BACL
MNDKRKGKAELTSMEGVIEVQCRTNLLGRIAWQAKTQYPSGTGAVLTFEFASDQSYLLLLLRELENILASYPVVGTS